MPLCGAEPSETPHRERPGRGIRRKTIGGEHAGGGALSLFYVEKSVDRKKISARDWQWGIGHAFSEPMVDAPYDP
jgi:hypothetical protein